MCISRIIILLLLVWKFEFIKKENYENEKIFYISKTLLLDFMPVDAVDDGVL